MEGVRVAAESPTATPLLKGLKVVEMATWLFGPMSACVLGEMGADVVKVEPHEGDPMRGLIHRLHDGVDWVFEIANRNKRSVALNVRTPEGNEILHKLLEDADVFLVNLRRGALERLGIDYESLGADHPRLIYAHATGYGTEGPDIDRPAFDELAYWARGGFMETLGPPDSEPVRLVGAMGDLPSAMNITAAIFAALYQREQTGEGQFVTCSLYGGGIWANGFAIQGALATGENFPRSDRYGAFNPLYNSYRAADGKWMQLAMILADRFWGPFADAIGLPMLKEDARFAVASDRRGHIREAVETIERRIAEHPRDHWAAIFDANDFPWAPAADSVEIANDPQASANGYVRTMQHKTAGDFRVLGVPFQLELASNENYSSAPELGEHTELVLEELGYDWDQIAAMKQSGAIP
ncbi:MAG: CoA transferase [Chloroflexi bacterium]|nr:CoA transferase [Chloroflexota bacterium]